MCYKALLLLEHLLKHGPGKIVGDVQVGRWVVLAVCWCAVGLRLRCAAALGGAAAAAHITPSGCRAGRWSELATGLCSPAALAAAWSLRAPLHPCSLQSSASVLERLQYFEYKDANLRDHGEFHHR